MCCAMKGIRQCLSKNRRKAENRPSRLVVQTIEMIDN